MFSDGRGFSACNVKPDHGEDDQKDICSEITANDAVDGYEYEKDFIRQRYPKG